MHRTPLKSERESSTRSDTDRVLPRMYYAVLALEVCALVVLRFVETDPASARATRYALGWTGVASMTLMHVYSLRRRVAALRNFGALKHWLHFHIFCGLQGALFVAYHSLHATALRNLQGLDIVGVAVVVASGLFGRYLYSFLPKQASGERLSLAEIDAELARLGRQLDDRSDELVATTPTMRLDAGELEDAPGSLGSLVRSHVALRRAFVDLRRRVQGLDPQLEQLGALALRRLTLSRRRATFEVAARWFAGWTWFHRPLTVVLLGITALHIFAHYVYGAR